MTTFVPQNAYITPASPVVVSQIGRLNSKADELLDRVNSALRGLLSLSFSNTDLDPRFHFDEQELESVLAQLGTLPNFDSQTDWLANLTLSEGDEAFRFNPEVFQYLRQMLPDFNLSPVGTLPALPDAPADPGEPTDVAAPLRPDLPFYAPPVIGDPVPVPEYQDFTSDIPFPVLRPITLPPAPEIDISGIVFEGVRPLFDAVPPDIADFQFENEEYSPLLLDKTKEVILSMMDGSTGLPAAVEDAIFERAREREIELGERDVSQATEEWAAKGYKRPPGRLASQVDRIRRDASFKVSAINRDQFIERWKLQLEQLRDALAKSIALEELWVRLFTSAEDRRLQAARQRMDLALGIFNAYVQRFQSESQLFAIDAQVFNAKFQAAQAQLQLYSEELRAKQLIGDLNEQDVRIFAQRVSALQVNADIYRARVEGVKATYDATRSQVDVFRAQLESNTALASLYESDVRAFGEQMRAQQTRDERFRIKADIYGRNIDAWKTRVDALYQQQDSELKLIGVHRDTFVANTERVRSFVDAEARRIAALTEKYQALAAEIGSKSEAENAPYQLMLSIAQAQIERMRAAADIMLKNGEINIQSGLTAENLMLRSRETAATLLAQLAAGFTSAANVNASISDGSSSSISYSFNGEIDT
jgi:hypothetical protein